MENKKFPVVVHEGDLAYYLDSAKFEHGQRVASFLAQASLVPEHYQKNPSNCLIALNQATLLKVDVLLFMQKTYAIKGKIGIESQLAIGLANRAKVFKDVIQYDFSGKGDDYQCRAFAVTAATGVKCEEICSVADAKSMGWWDKRDRNGKNVSPWPKQTKKMLRYRSAINLIRAYCPEVLLGLDTAEELKDAPAEEIDITREVEVLNKKSDLAAATEKAKQKSKPADERQEKENSAPPPPEIDEQDFKGKGPEVRHLAEINSNPSYLVAIQDAIANDEFTAASIQRAIDANDEKTAAKIIEAINKYVG